MSGKNSQLSSSNKNSGIIKRNNNLFLLFIKSVHNEKRTTMNNALLELLIYIDSFTHTDKQPLNCTCMF